MKLDQGRAEQALEILGSLEKCQDVRELLRLLE